MSNAKFKCSWKNGIIGSISIAVLSAVLRYVLWYFMIYISKDPTTGDYKYVADPYFALGMMIVAFVFGVICFLLSYYGYTKLAANHPEDLYGVGHGKYGRPWIAQLVLLVLMEVIWIAAVVCINKFAKQDPYSQLIMLSSVMAICTAADIGLFVLGNILLKPQQIAAQS